MAVELASAYVTIIPSLRGAQGALAKEFTSSSVMSEADRAGKSIGERLVGGATKAIKLTSFAVAGLAAAVTGLAVKGGISRQLNIEDAQAKLKGLGNDTATVTAIMSDAMAAVKGTSYGMDAAATTAASAVAAGIKPGKELEGYLKLTADAATIAGTSMGDMGDIMNKVTSSGKAQMDNLNQLSSRGIPIMQWLGEEYGVTQEELSKMVAAGQVDAETFRKVIGENIGGAALESGNTTRGAYANMMAALSRVGVQLTQWFFPLIKGVFNGVTTILDGVTDALKPWSEAMTESFGDIAGPAVENFGQATLDILQRVVGGLTTVVDAVRVFSAAFAGADASGLNFTGLLATAVTAGTALAGLREEVVGGVQAMVAAFQAGGDDVTSGGFAGILETVGLVARALWDSLGPALAELGPNLFAVVTAFSPLGTIFKALEPILPQVATALVAIATALGGTLAAILPTVTTLMQTVAEVLSGVLVQILPTITDLVVTLADVFAALVPPLADVATTLVLALGDVLPVVGDLIGELVAGLAPILPTIAGLMGTVASVVVDLVKALAPTLPTIAALVKTLVSSLAPILPTIAKVVGQVAGALGNVLVGAVKTLLPIVVQLIDTALAVLVPLLPTVGTLLGVVAEVFGVLVQALMPLLPPILSLVQVLISALVPILPTLTDLLTTVAGVVLSLIVALTPLLPTITNLISVGLNVLVMILAPLTKAISLVASVILTGLQVAIKTVMPVITGIIGIVTTLAQILSTVVAVAFQVLSSVVTTVWDAIFTVINAVWGTIRDTIFAPLNLAVEAVGGGFRLAKDAIKIAWDGVQSVLGAGWDWISEHVLAPLGKGVEAIGTAFESAKDVVSKAWQDIQDAAVKPVNFVIREVYTNGIKDLFDTVAEKLGLSLRLPVVPEIKGPSGSYATGGVLPGYTPGQDVHHFRSPTAGRLSLSGGEAIMVPEWTRAVGGPSAVAAMNAQARAGRGIAGGNQQAFWGGGVWGWVKEKAGDAWDFTKNAASAIANFMKDPVAGALEIISKPVMALLGGVGGGQIGEIVSEVPKTLVKAIVDGATSIFGPARDDGTDPATAGAVGPGGSPMGVAGLTAALGALIPGARVTSGLRRGATVAGTGNLSMHGMGRAIDIGSPTMAMFDKILTAYPFATELLYSPAGPRQRQRGRGGSFAGDTSGVTKRMHYDHIHWGMKDGGVVPKLYDDGGWLEPGLSVVENRTGAPEPVLTGSQWNSLDKSGNGGVFHYHAAENRSLTAEQELIKAVNRAPTLSKFGRRR